LTFLLLALLSSAPSCFAQTNGEIDVGVSISAGSTMINYAAVLATSPAFSLTVNSTQSGTFTLSVAIQPSFNAAGIQTNLFANLFPLVGDSIQLVLTFSTSGVTSITLTTPALDASIFAMLSAQLQVGVVQVSGNVYTQIPCQLNQQTVTVVLPSVGTYAFVTVQAIVPPIAYGTGQFVIAKSNQILQWGNNETQISYYGNISNTVTVTEHAANPFAQATIQTSIGVFLTVQLANEAATHQSKILYHFTQAQVKAAAVVASTMTFEVYSTVSTTWTHPPVAASCDVSAMVVTQTTTSFSDWAVTASSSSSTGSQISSNILALAFAVLVPIGLALL